uniref:Protein arginine methyltransferase NDUFAF7 n=1 Tax=Rhabditophanes sp. KR3021 TaxID=114890 RepID=A0AC35TTX9_9BILA
MASGSAAGYYSNFNKDNFKIFGDEGDFVTAPEICQIFGESIAVWLFSELTYTGYKGPWQLVELGPGSGKLMFDVINSLRRFDSLKTLSVHLVEVSDTLAKEQEKKLCGSVSEAVSDKDYYRKNTTRDGIEIYWYKLIDNVPENFSVIIANEFLDALPVHQFKRVDGKFREIYLNLNKENELVFMEGKGSSIHSEGLVPEYVKNRLDVGEYEISPEAGTFVTQIAQRITHKGGFALLIDYGHNGERKSFSLRGYKKHEEVKNLLERPGEFDITADVNFEYLKKLVETETLVFGPITQRDFILKLGGAVRLKMLLRTISGDVEKQNQLFDAFEMLTGEGDNMGIKFKLLSIFPATLKGILEKRENAPIAFVDKLIS